MEVSRGGKGGPAEEGAAGLAGQRADGQESERGKSPRAPRPRASRPESRGACLRGWEDGGAEQSAVLISCIKNLLF